MMKIKKKVEGAVLVCLILKEIFSLKYVSMYLISKIINSFVITNYLSLPFHNFKLNLCHLSQNYAFFNKINF